MAAKQKGKDSVGGMDHWKPAEFAMLGKQACGRLADLLNTIELGGAWPKRLEQAKAGFLAKDPDKPLDPHSLQGAYNSAYPIS